MRPIPPSKPSPHDTIWHQNTRFFLSLCAPRDYADKIAVLTLLGAPCAARWLNANHVTSSRWNYYCARRFLRTFTEFIEWDLLDKDCGALTELRNVTARLRKLTMLPKERQNRHLPG